VALLDLLLLIPVLGALAVLALPAERARTVALLVTLIELAVSLQLWFGFNSHAGMQFQVARGWIPAYGVDWRLGVDGISLFMVLLTTVTMPLAVLSSWNYITEKHRAYYALLLVLTTGMIGVFVALDMFVFYVFWELMLIPMYFIIGIWGGTRKLYAAIKFFLYTFVGSLLMLVAILVLYWQVGTFTGTYSFAYSHLLANADVVQGSALWLFGAFALAFAIKVPVFPFHTWLPDAHVEAPTAGSVILAGILLKMGTYGFLRFALPLFPDAAFHPTVVTVVVVLAVIGIVYGALVAMVQPDFKKLVAYSSVSHLGFVMLGIWALNVQSVTGAIVIMISHGISTGALFLIIGMLYERRHTREIAAFGGIARSVPMLSAILTLVALSSIGLPGTNGFIGEFLVLLGSFREFPVATGIATTGVIFAAAYLLWALQRILFNKEPEGENATMKDLSARELVILIPVVIAIVWIGLYPKPILDRIEPSVERLIVQVRPMQVERVVSPVRSERREGGR